MECECPCGCRKPVPDDVERPENWGEITYCADCADSRHQDYEAPVSKHVRLSDFRP